MDTNNSDEATNSSSMVRRGNRVLIVEGDPNDLMVTIHCCKNITMSVEYQISFLSTKSNLLIIDKFGIGLQEMLPVSSFVLLLEVGVILGYNGLHLNNK